MNTKQKGDLSQAKVICYLLEKQYVVSVPVGENSRYDLIAEKGGKFYRIQVKTGNEVKKNVFRFDTCSTYSHKSGTYTRSSYIGQIEFFGVYLPEVDRVLIIDVNNAPRRAGTINLETGRLVEEALC